MRAQAALLVAGAGVAAAAGWAAGGVLVATRTAIPVDERGNLKSTLAGSLSLGLGAMVGVAALVAARAPGGHLKGLAIAGGGLAAATAGLGAGMLVEPRTRFVTNAFGFGFTGTADYNGGGPGVTTAQVHRVNNTYTPVAGDQLPDGVPQRPEGVFYQPKLLGGPKLRFTTTVADMGEGPLQLGIRKLGTDGAVQLVTNDGASDGVRPITMRGEFIYHAVHRHIHFDDWLNASLFKAKPDHTAGEPVGSSKKLSFNIADTDHSAPWIDPEGKRQALKSWNTFNIQGVSPGWDDTYGPQLSGQSIDVGKLDDGEYVLRQEFDPGDRIAESNEANNVRDTVLRVKHGRVTIVDDPGLEQG